MATVSLLSLVNVPLLVCVQLCMPEEILPTFNFHNLNQFSEAKDIYSIMSQIMKSTHPLWNPCFQQVTCLFYLTFCLTFPSNERALKTLIIVHGLSPQEQ